MNRITGLSAIALLCVSGSAFAADTQVTFAKDVAPIFQAKCETCHRDGQGAPMSLSTYEQARPWARSIKARVASRNMPPWHLDKTVGIQEFQNDRSLSDAQIATIVKWVDQGAVLGDKKDLPPAIQWPDESGWKYSKVIGKEPDLVIKSEPYTVKAVNQDEWWKPVSDVPVTEERWVRAVEMRPGTIAGRRITHHALAQLEQYEPPAADDIGGGGPGLLMEWAIGKNYDAYREDAGKLLLPGSKIRWDIHYHSVGEDIRDHVELAIWLYPAGYKPAHRTRLNILSAYKTQNDLDIAPNSIAQTQSFHVMKSAGRLESFQPHMHLRGKGMSMEAILPSGEIRMLSYVDHFDFNWMNVYQYTDDSAPVLPKGTILRVTAYYDNTAANKGNPDPGQWVGYGDRTVDEMGHAWVNITNISDEEYNAWVAKHKNKGVATGGGQ
ncbi:MAG TPA: cytochrome c [Bryobacteraceae bacterium]|nr:cytochrome c [Bryobacteraceae bacterium]